MRGKIFCTHPNRSSRLAATAVFGLLTAAATISAGRAQAQAPSELPSLPASAELGLNQIETSWRALFGEDTSAAELRAWRALRGTTALGEEPLHQHTGLDVAELAGALAALEADGMLAFERALELPWVGGDARAAAWNSLLADPDRLSVGDTGTATDRWSRRIDALRAELAWNDLFALMPDECAPHLDAHGERDDASRSLASARWYRPESAIEPEVERPDAYNAVAVFLDVLRGTGGADTDETLNAQSCVPSAWNALLLLERAPEQDWLMGRDALLLLVQRHALPATISARLMSAAYLRGDLATLTEMLAALRGRPAQVYAPQPVLADALHAALLLAANLSGDEHPVPPDDELDALMFRLVTYPEPIMRWAHAELVRLRGEQITARTRLGAVLAADPFYAPALLSRSSTWVMQSMGSEAFADLLFLERAWGDHPLYAPAIEGLSGVIR
jgi:hypothetical protein